MIQSKAAQWRFVSRSAAQTKSLGRTVARLAGPGDAFLLIGNLGMGKTTFVQGFVRGAGVSGDVLSPTFVLAQSYDGRCPVHHLDFYRANPKELVDAGVQDYVAGQGEIPPGIVLIEWAGRCPDFWPEDRVEIRISMNLKTKHRVFQFRGVGTRGRNLVKAAHDRLRD